jgi:hypothetical protein
MMCGHGMTAQRQKIHKLLDHQEVVIDPASLKACTLRAPGRSAEAM